jgi:eukaryotic-like serine/threonine-protein kinase
VLGVLAIVIAILIVLNAQDRKDRETPPPTVTNTITETTPNESPAAMPGPDWTDGAAIGHGGGEIGVPGIDAIPSPATVQVTRLAPEQTWQ